MNNSRDVTNDEAVILIEEDHESMQDELNSEIEFQLENEFGEYLQGWAEMLEEKRISNLDEDIDDIDEDNVIDNIIYSAIDTNAKWKLKTLFKNGLKLPF